MAHTDISTMGFLPDHRRGLDWIAFKRRASRRWWWASYACAPTASQGASNPGSGTRRARSRSSVQCQNFLVLVLPSGVASYNVGHSRHQRQHQMQGSTIESRCPTTPRMGVCMIKRHNHATQTTTPRNICATLSSPIMISPPVSTNRRRRSTTSSRTTPVCNVRKSIHTVFQRPVALADPRSQYDGGSRGS